jgi:hypothetical protein
MRCERIRIWRQGTVGQKFGNIGEEQLCVRKIAGSNVKKQRKADKNSVARVRQRTIPTERSPLVGEVSDNVYG